jgi:hypothetical protein
MLAADSNAAPFPVMLPGGVWPEDASVAGPSREVMARPVSVDDALALFEGRSRAPAERATDLLARCLVDGQRIASKLAIGDREAVLLRLRQRIFGDAAESVVTCPSPGCGARLELRLTMSDLLVAAYSEVRRQYDLAVDTADGIYDVTFRLPTGADLARAAVIAPEDPELAAGVILAQCVIAAARGGAVVETDALPECVRSAIAAAMADRDPQAEINLHLQCPDCGESFITILDVASFFLRELEADTARLIGDVHTLASHYHWSEADILRMPAARRERYLQLVATAGSHGPSA